MRKTVTLPEAGKTLNLGLTGRSIVIEDCAVFETVDDVPILDFQGGQGQFPIYPRNVYSNPEGKFNDVVITSTEDSAGTEATFFVSDECLETRFNIVLDSQYKSVPGTMFPKVASNAVQQLAEIDLVDADGNLPTVVYVSVSPTAGTSGIKWSINSDPVQGNDSLGVEMKPGDIPYPIKDVSWILSFRFIASVLDETPVVNFIPEY